MAATALTLRRTAPKFLAILRPTYFASAGSRSFTSNAGISCFNDSDSEDDGERQFPSPRNLVLSRPPPSFSDVFGPNPIDQLFTVNPFLATGPRRGWDVEEDKDGLYLRMDMPGLGKENVKVSVERNTLVIKGEGEEEPEEGERRRYSNRIDLPGEMFKLDRIKAEMKNGLLKVMVPKVKAEERTDVRQVQIQ